MASIDHTARLRHLVRNEPKSKSTSTFDRPPHQGSVERERRQAHESQRASTALAVAVIEGMLKTHSTFKKTHKNGDRSGLLPFNAVQLIGLESAIEILHQHVDTLSSEVSG
jgi:2,3-bisphosphoglycerate-independent phosphoglycerate mutase